MWIRWVGSGDGVCVGQVICVDQVGGQVMVGVSCSVGTICSDVHAAPSDMGEEAP